MLLAQLVRHSSFISSRRLGASVSVLCGVRKAAAAGMAGMASATNELQKEHLTEQKTVTALVVPKKQCATTMKLFKGRTFKMPRMKCLVENPGDKDSKLLLLDESLLPSCIPTQLDASLSTHLAENSIKRVLPEDIEVPSSFEAVGHIAHFNLREQHMPYRKIIGQVCIDKNPSIKTVVTKVKEIANEFRVFDMEVIAGEQNFVTEVNQYGLRFKLDFSKVFWNSRLEFEHKRLVDKYFQRGQVVLDVMAGIGPFAVPAAKGGCTVIANDLNPDSAQWLRVNTEINHVKKNVHPLCMDGRECIRWITCGNKAGLAAVEAVEGGDGKAGNHPRIDVDADSVGAPEWAPPPGGVRWDHAVMNLPRTAVEFCDAFRGVFDPSLWKGQLPLVHCYTFQKSETEAEVLKRLEDALGGALDEPAEVHQVRHVAPDKYHVCVSFRVPEAVAFARQGDDRERENKRQKVDA